MSETDVAGGGYLRISGIKKWGQSFGHDRRCGLDMGQGHGSLLQVEEVAKKSLMRLGGRVHMQKDLGVPETLAQGAQCGTTLRFRRMKSVATACVLKQLDKGQRWPLADVK